MVFVYKGKGMKGKLNKFKHGYGRRALVALALVSCSAAATAAATTLGDMASSIIDSFENLGLLITGASYLAGLGFSVGAIMKFKAHKDNPTQITIGTPIALVFVAAALLFLPSILKVTGQTMFGGAGETAGPAGIEITGS